MVNYTTLQIPAFGGGDLPNTFVRQAAGPSQHLAILLPGVSYTTDMPALYYARAVLLARGADALSVEVNYGKTPGYRQGSPEEQYRRLTEDAAAACAAALVQGAYERITLVGKSLGTLAMGYLVANDSRLAQASCIWLTPLLRQESLRTQIRAARPRSLFVSGGGDSLYDAAAQAELEQALGARSLVIAGADHSLELPGDPATSVSALARLVEAIDQFIQG